MITATHKELKTIQNNNSLFQLTFETTIKVVQNYQDGKLQQCENKCKQVRQLDQNPLIKSNFAFQPQKIKLKSQTKSFTLKYSTQIQQNVKQDNLNQSFNEYIKNKQQQQEKILASRSSSQESVSKEFSEYNLVPYTKSFGLNKEDKDLNSYINKKDLNGYKIQEIIPCVQGDELTKIGQNEVKLVLPNGSISIIDYFSHQNELRYDKFPKTIQELKIGNYQDQNICEKQQRVQLNKIDSKYYQSKQSREIVKVRASNRISEELLKDHKKLEDKSLDMNTYLMHFEQITESEYFCNLDQKRLFQTKQNQIR
ncbi:unnamed protein product [Paramecium sonneborni]|uniref:Uncharacterized protein n=1 Tax=Paramecium sonneborni TaxID=65129 RepID=A0A8S1Q0J2_9CILI|nr:unnamed protein product [Paramecium sonneborni]